MKLIKWLIVITVLVVAYDMSGLKEKGQMALFEEHIEDNNVSEKAEVKKSYSKNVSAGNYMCSDYVNEYKKVFAQESITQEFVFMYRQALIFSGKEEEFDKLSSENSLKAQLRTVEYCKIIIKSENDKALSLAINKSL